MDPRIAYRGRENLVHQAANCRAGLGLRIALSSCSSCNGPYDRSRIAYEELPRQILTFKCNVAF